MPIQIYDAQMDAIKKAALQGFLGEMLAHVKQFFPNHYRMFEANDLLAFCEYTLQKAASYGYETERDIFFFLNVMILLGQDFDSDPLLVWSTDILKDEIAEPEYNIELLAESTSTWVNRIAGPNNEHFEQALLSFQEGGIEQFSIGSDAELSPHLLVLFENIYPQKYAVLSRNELDAFIDQGIGCAHKYGLDSNLSVSVYLSLMFLFGVSIANDYRFACFKNVLAQASAIDANQIDKMMFDKSVNSLNAYLQRTIS